MDSSRNDIDRASGQGVMGRGPEPRVAGLTIAVLLLLGACMGTVNLFVPGMVPDGTRRWVYAATMALPVLAVILLVVRRRVTPNHTPSGWSCSVTSSTWWSRSASPTPRC